MDTHTEKNPECGEDESDANRMVTPETMSIELVSAFAGGRGLTEANAARLRMQKMDRGPLFFSDLLYAVSHHYFTPRIAEDLWGEILSHKEQMAVCLGRDVGVVVATLDYLSNITNEMVGLTLISERHVLAGREHEGDNLGTQARAGCRPHRPPVGSIPGNPNEAEQPLAVATGHAGVTPRSTGE